MSQKPRTGAPSKPGLASKEAPTKATSIKTAAAAEPEPTPEVRAEPVAEPLPVMQPEPEVEAAPVSIPEPEVSPLVEAAETVEMALEEAVTTATEAIPEPAAIAAEPVTAAAESVASLTARTIETAIEPRQTTLTRGMKTMMKSTEDFVAFGQANLEAFMKSGQIWSAGVQELTKQIATSAKASFEESVSTFKAISTAKSVKEAMELQSTFAKAALEKAMAESNKLTDASIKLTEQTLAPITARVTVAVETFGKTAAV